MLNDAAGKSRDAEQNQRNADGGGNIHRQRLDQGYERGAVGRDVIGFGQ